MRRWKSLGAILLILADAHAVQTVKVRDFDSEISEQLEDTPSYGALRAGESSQPTRRSRHGKITELDIMSLPEIAILPDMAPASNTPTMNGQTGEKRKRRSFDFDVTRWPAGIVYYQFEPHFNRTPAFDELFNSLKEDVEALTCGRLVARNSQRNFISIGSYFPPLPHGCWSFIGMLGGKQELSLPSPGCHVKRIMMHELLHTYGFRHEQNRMDRDEHVEIVYENVNPKLASNFRKFSSYQSSKLIYSSHYDYESIMHYGAYSFSKGQEITIRTLDLKYQDKIGKYTHVSHEDVNQFNAAYNCKENPEFHRKSASGEIKSPRYPSHFPGDTWREWKISVPSGRVKLVSRYMQLESTRGSTCHYDYIEIYDGHTMSDPKLGKFCGFGPIKVIASGRRMMVRFFSDTKVNGRFRLQYSSELSPEIRKTTTTTPAPTTKTTTTKATTTARVTNPGANCLGLLPPDPRSVPTLLLPCMYYVGWMCTTNPSDLPAFEGTYRGLWDPDGDNVLNTVCSPTSHPSIDIDQNAEILHFECTPAWAAQSKTCDSSTCEVCAGRIPECPDASRYSYIDANQRNFAFALVMQAEMKFKCRWSAQCESKWILVDGTCMRVISAPAGIRQADAEVACVALDGHLATIGNVQRVGFSIALILTDYYGTGADYIWIGANKATHVWGWTDGTAWSYTNWRNYPTKDCGVVRPSGQWDSIACTDTRPGHFLCEKPTIVTTTTTTTITTKDVNPATRRPRTSGPTTTKLPTITTTKRPTITTTKRSTITTTKRSTIPRRTTVPSRPTTKQPGTPCGGDITSSYGEISSPGYPGNYANNLRCEWRITVPLLSTNNSIHFSSSSFVTQSNGQCEDDYVTLFEGHTTSAALGQWCGTKRVDVITRSNKALLKFTSDASGRKRGFKILFRTYSGDVSASGPEVSVAMSKIVKISIVLTICSCIY